MVKLLVVSAGLDGALLVVLGGFFIYASFTRGATHRRISLFLGSMMVASGIANLLVFYTGGLGLYLAVDGSTGLALVALAARFVAGILLLAIIIDSLIVWRQAQQNGGRKDGKKSE